MKTVTIDTLNMLKDTYFEPIYLIDINRENIATGVIDTLKYAYPSPVGEYIDAVMNIDPITISMAPSGGLIQQAPITLYVDNKAANYLSNMLDDYLLDNNDVTLRLTLTGAVEDAFAIYKGVVRDIHYNAGTLIFTIIDSQERDLIEVPVNKLNLTEYPNLPLDLLNRPKPFTRGRLNNTNTFGNKNFNLAPMPCVDFNELLYLKTTADAIGSVHSYFQSSDIYTDVPSSQYSVTGDILRITGLQRQARYYPSIAKLVETDTFVVLDGQNTFTINSNQVLEPIMGGIVALGDLLTAKLNITNTGSIEAILTKGDTTHTVYINNSGSIDLHTQFDLDSWDFGNIKISLKAAGAITITEISLVITFNHTERQEQIFYQTNGKSIKPSQLIKQLLNNMSILDANINLTDTADESGWDYDVSITDILDRRQFDNLCNHLRMRIIQDEQGKWKLSLYNLNADPVWYFSDDNNILAPPELDQLREPRILRTADAALANEFVLEYAYDYARDKYTKAILASPHYVATGNALLRSHPNGARFALLYDPNATFNDDEITKGQTVYVQRDIEYIIVDKVNNNSVLIQTKDPEFEANVGHTDTYYIGWDFSARCFLSRKSYRKIQRFTQGITKSQYIQKDSTAQRWLQHLISYFSTKYTVVEFISSYGAAALELGDFIAINHAAVQPSKRPILLTTQAELELQKDATTIAFSSGEGYRFKNGDFIVLEDANYGQEVIKITGNPAVNMTFERGQLGTTPRLFSGDVKFSRIQTKYEILHIAYEQAQIRISAREAPLWYSAPRFYAPDNIPDWDSATIEQKLIYAFYSYSDGRLTLSGAPLEGGVFE